MSTRVIKVRVGGDENSEGVEGSIHFFSMRLGGRAAARVKLDESLMTALSSKGTGDDDGVGGTEGAQPGPSPTELSFAGDDELEALSRAEAWVRRQFEVVEVQNTRRKKRDSEQ